MCAAELCLRLRVLYKGGLAAASVLDHMAVRAFSCIPTYFGSGSHMIRLKCFVNAPMSAGAWLGA